MKGSVKLIKLIVRDLKIKLKPSQTYLIIIIIKHITAVNHKKYPEKKSTVNAQKKVRLFFTIHSYFMLFLTYIPYILRVHFIF